MKENFNECTEEDSRILKAQVVAVDMKHVVIICPVCGQFHWHGTGGFGINKLNYGTRVPHCTTKDIAKKCDKSEPYKEYELITSKETIRREKTLPKDLTAWRSRQRSVRRDMEEQWRLKEEADRDERILKTVRDISRMERWLISDAAMVAPIHVTRWMNRHGIYYEDVRYRVVFASKAGPELCEIFGKYEDKK